MNNAAILCLGLLALTLEHNKSIAKAEESNSTKIENKAGDIKTDTQKMVRKGKRKVRKATGNDTLGKDIKDKANDVRDDISNNSDKMQRK